ncbi:flagellar biosynthesis protein FlhB [bacterium]|nr:flagellar biosynthesis protein FlhB [bacterium]
MPEDTGQERTEQATQKRREETRKRGQVARSTEVSSAIMLLAGFSVLMLFRRHILQGLERYVTGVFTQSYTYDLGLSNIRGLLMNAIITFFTILLPVFVVMAIAGIAVNVLQVGFLFTGEPLMPKAEKINPFEGAKRILSRRSFETLVRDVIKIIVVAWIGYRALRGFMNDIMIVSDSTVGNIFAFTGYTVFSIALKILIGYAVIAILDYGFQRWDYERSMMMTRQELKEEMKQAEGDPLLRARIRSVQRELSRRRMMEEVPKAEVVVTNPTRLAVALSYQPGMTAPVVVAKGKNLIAEKIRTIAIESGVPIIENVLLAQALFKAVEIGNPIPPDLYTAVAEVLAYVYRLKGKKVV